MTDTQLDLFPVTAHLRRIDPTRNMRRFYRLCLQPDLFGGCTLVREWGRIGSNGRIRHDPYPDEGQALEALRVLTEQKERRGYAAP